MEFGPTVWAGTRWENYPVKESKEPAPETREPVRAVKDFGCKE